MKTRTVTLEIRVDVARDSDRAIGEEVGRALDFAKFVNDRTPMNEWIVVPCSTSDFCRRGPTHIRFTHEVGE